METNRLQKEDGNINIPSESQFSLEIHIEKLWVKFGLIKFGYMNKGFGGTWNN